MNAHELMQRVTEVTQVAYCDQHMQTLNSEKMACACAYKMQMIDISGTSWVDFYETELYIFHRMNQ